MRQDVSGCPSCGAELASGATSCTSCGHPLADPVPGAAPAAEGSLGTEPPGPAAGEGTRRARRRGTVAALLVACVVVAVAAIVVALTGGGPSRPTDPQGVADAAAADVQNGNLAGVCGLVAPGQRSQCQVAVASVQQLLRTDGYSIDRMSMGTASVAGSSATVPWSDRLCEHTACFSASSTSSQGDHPMVLHEVHGTWYVESAGLFGVGMPSGPTGATGATGSKGAAYAAAQSRSNVLAHSEGCPYAPATAAHPANTLRWRTQPAMALDPTRTYYATIVTTQGTFRVLLNSKGAPVNVNNFVFLAEHHFYDCNDFHRVIPGFMDQTGDPTGTGTGGPGFAASANEFPAARATPSEIQYPKGTVAMANSCSSTVPARCPLTNGSQFFIVADNLPESTLAPQYTVIGTVVSGIAAVERINRTGDAADNGTPPFVVNRILSVTITST